MKLDTSKMTREEIEIIRDFYFLHTFRKVAEKRKLPYETVRNFIKTLRLEDVNFIKHEKEKRKKEQFSEMVKQKNEQISMMVKRRDELAQEIIQDYIRLGTLQKVADERGVSRQRVHQILSRIGYKKPKKYQPTKEERFAIKVNKFWNNTKKLDNGCLEWCGSKYSTGYGRVRFMGIGGQYAHRVAWILTYGEIPAMMWVIHRCNNRACINPEHLSLSNKYDWSNDKRGD